MCFPPLIAYPLFRLPRKKAKTGSSYSDSLAADIKALLNARELRKLDVEFQNLVESKPA